MAIVNTQAIPPHILVTNPALYRAQYGHTTPLQEGLMQPIDEHATTYVLSILSLSFLICLAN